MIKTCKNWSTHPCTWQLGQTELSVEETEPLNQEALQLDIWKVKEKETESCLFLQVTPGLFFKKKHPILFKYRNVFFLYRNVLTLFCGMINMSNETECKERKDNTSLVTTFSNSKLINENIYMTTVTIDY